MTKRAVRRQLVWTSIVLVAGYVVFASLYLEFYRPYFPRIWDQLEYLNKVYAAYYAIIDAKTFGAVVEAFATHIVAFKGSIAGSLSLGGMLVFGPDRLVAASVNYLFLLYLAAVAISTLSSEEAPYFGSILFGLVLLSNSLYFPAGGMFDARLDLPGLCTFGAFVVALVGFDRDPSRKRTAVVLATAAVTLFTRSITGLYLVGTLLAYTTLLGIEWWLGRSRTRALRFALFLTLVAVIGVAAYIVEFWYGIRPYYIAQFESGEVEFRRFELGVSSPLTLPFFYLKSAWSHLWPMLAYTAALLAAAVLARLLRKAPKSGVAPAGRPETSPIGIAMVCASSALAILVPLVTSSPSPVVAGALTVPIAVVCTAGLYRFVGNHMRLSGPILARATLAAGAVYFFVKVAIGSPPTLGEMAYLRAHNDFYKRLSADLDSAQGTVAWFVLAEGINSLAFHTYLYENRLPDRVAAFQQLNVNIFAPSLPALESAIARADAVVVWSRFPSGQSYPGIESLRASQADWLKKIEHRFVARFELSAGLPGVVTYYLRNPRIVSLPEPVESVRFGAANSLPFVWLTEAGSAFRIRNLSGHPVEATLHARAVPGPSFQDRSRRSLRIATAGESFQVEATEAAQWQISQRLVVPAGESEVRLHAVAPPSPRVPVPNDPRTLIVGIWGLRLD